MVRPDLTRIGEALAAEHAKSLRSDRDLSREIREDIAWFLEHLNPRSSLTRIGEALAAEHAKSLRSDRDLLREIRDDIAWFLEHLNPQSRETEIYVRWLRSDRDLSLGVPIRASMATFLEQLTKPQKRGRPPVETILQRYARRQERMPWITRVLDRQRELRRRGERKHFEVALEIVASEPGAPAVGTLRNWVRRDKGNSRFLPVFDDGTPNVDPEPI